MASQSQELKLPQVSTPRLGEGGSVSARAELESREEAFVSDAQQELKMLNWYKLANEAAMKAALVRQKRYKEVPRYNPAAERVRQRGTWMAQVIAEEQNKPLELKSDTFVRLMQKDSEERQRQQVRIQDRYQKIRQLKSELQEKEERRMQYRRFLAEQEKHRRKAMANSGQLDSIYGDDLGISEDVGMSVDAVVTLQNLDRLEERVATIIKDEQTKVPGSIVLDLTKSQDVGVATVQNADPTTLNSEQVTFVKRRTEPRLNAPSQVFYAAKVLPPTYERKEAVALRNEFLDQDIPEHVVQHMKSIEEQRSIQSAGSRPDTGAYSGRGSHSAHQSRDPSKEELRAQRSAEAYQKRQEKDEQRQKELMEQERVDEVIKDWLRGRNRRALKREKKIRDVMRADRRFLSQLQVTKDTGKQSGSGDAGNASSAPVVPPGAGWTPNFDFNLDDVDKKLEVLLQQQKSLQKWKPKVSKVSR